MTVEIRPANPVPAEAAAFARLANMTSHNIVGADAEAVVTAMFLGDSTLYRARQVWIVDVDGEIAGMLCAFSGRQKVELTGETDRQLLDTPGARSAAAVHAQNQLEPISGFIDTVPEEAFYVQFVAVEPHARGKGYAGQLLAFADDLAREAGTATLELDVETGNAAALAAYRRRGLEIVRTSAEVRYQAQGRTLALHRMAKVIGSVSQQGNR